MSNVTVPPVVGVVSLGVDNFNLHHSEVGLSHPEVDLIHQIIDILHIQGSQTTEMGTLNLVDGVTVYQDQVLQIGIHKETAHDNGTDLQVIMSGGHQLQQEEVFEEEV